MNRVRRFAIPEKELRFAWLLPPVRDRSLEVTNEMNGIGNTAASSDRQKACGTWDFAQICVANVGVANPGTGKRTGKQILGRVVLLIGRRESTVMLAVMLFVSPCVSCTPQRPSVSTPAMLFLTSFRWGHRDYIYCGGNHNLLEPDAGCFNPSLLSTKLP